MIPPRPVKIAEEWLLAVSQGLGTNPDPSSIES